MQKDALKLFDMFIGSYLFFVKTIRITKAKRALRRICTLFSQECHNWNSKSFIIMQKDVLKLFDMFMSLYLSLVKTLKNYKC